MVHSTRRDFLADVGKGMLTAGLGSALAADLGVAAAHDGPDALSFGQLEPLVVLMQETPADKLLPILVGMLSAGTDLKTLVTAAALANARTFGGQDYVGFHTLMALTPAYHMAGELPENRRPLPVLKVLYRNTSRIQAMGGRKNEVLHPVIASSEQVTGETVRNATRRGDYDAAEKAFATVARGPVGEAFNHLQFAVEDEVDVHRVVLAWRAWTLLDFTGPEQAHTLLRQSVRYCVQSEKQRIDNKRPEPAIRTVLPKLLDQYGLIGKPAGTRMADDVWVEKLGEVIYSGGRDRAADAVAAALSEGFTAQAVGEAIMLAANLLVLRDPGRNYEQPGKSKGSCHGDSVGVHASDAANAWRHIAGVGDRRTAVASLIVGAYHTAGQHAGQDKETYPPAAILGTVATTDAAGLLRETDAAIRAKDQARACALVTRYGSLGHPARGVQDLLLGYATSEDGALHAEKYYRTTCEEFATARAAFRWRHLAALARVTASEYGQPAAGYADAARLLNV